MLPRGSLAIVTADVGWVVDAAALAFDVSADDLRGPRRAQPLTTYRHVAMAAARTLGHSFYAVGESFGGRHYSTVMHACSKVAADPQLSRRARALAEAVTETPGSLF